jgi:hypothetical protein
MLGPFAILLPSLHAIGFSQIKTLSNVKYVSLIQPLIFLIVILFLIEFKLMLYVMGVSAKYEMSVE